MTSRRAALSILASFAVSGLAAAFGPVLPSPVMPAGVEAGRGLAVRLPRGVTHVQLDQNLVEALPVDGEFTLLGFPLSDGRLVDLSLERFDPVAPDAKILVGTTAEDGTWIQDGDVQRPTVRCFRGTISGQPDSVAFLSFAPTSNVGLIVTEASETFSISDGTVDEPGPMVVTNMQELPEDAIEWARFQCGNAGGIGLPAAGAMPPETGLPRTGCRLFKLAIDTDFEFHDRFPTSPNKTTNALTYISQQMGAFATVYYHQLNVDATLQYLRLWKTKPASGYPYRSDYATSGGTGGFLADVKTRWLSNTADMAQTRDLVIGLSGQNLGGGVANGFRVVCNNNTGYCVAGSLSLSFPYPLQNKNAQNWDCVVFMHEIGHCFGAFHPHDNGDDDCFKQDYSGLGPCTMRAQGTIMSYCHLCSGGMTNINFRFSDRNKGVTQIGAGLPTYTCMAACGPTNSSTLSASACTPGEVNLTWTAVTGNKGYRIYRDDGVTVPVAMIKEASMNATSYKDTPVAAGKRYTYHVRPLLLRTDSANGSSVVEGPPSNDAAGGTAMAPPTGLAATRNPATGNVNLTWNAATGVTEYQVYRKVGTDAETKIGTDVPTNSFLDTTIPAGRLATYRVTAGTGSCESLSSDPVQGGIGVIDLTASAGTSSAGVQLNWTAVDTATSYKVFRADGNNIAGTPATPVLPDPVTNSFVDTTAVQGKFYTYALKAVLPSGQSDLGNRSAGWRNAAAPTALTATDGSRSDGVQLSWTAPTGDISDYEVSRSAGGAPPTVVTPSGSPTTTSYLDSSAIPHVEYTYTVRARTIAGKVANVFTAASTGNVGWRSNGPPSSVMASDGESTTAVIVSFVGVPGTLSYKIFRGPAGLPDGSMTLLATTSITPYRDTTAEAGVLYKYGIRSVTPSGDTAMSPTDTGFRGLAAPSTVRASQGTFTDRVEVSWTAVTGATGYRVYRGTAGTPATTPLLTTTELSFTDTTGTAGVLYAYTLVSMTAGGESRYSNTTGGWRNVSPPSDIAASDGTFTDRVRITWTPIVATPRYAVYRRLGLQSPQRLSIITGSSYDDRTARAGVLYSYTVRAVVTPGESRDSLPDTGWRFNSSGPNPDGGGGGGGGAGSPLPATTDGGFRGSSSGALVAAGSGSHGSEDGEAPAGGSMGDPLFERIAASDPAWRLDCERATPDEAREAILSGSRDADADGQPDVCQRERGDLDLSGTVDAGDLVLLLLIVGEDDPVMGDFNHDGCIDRDDLSMLQDLVAEQQARDELEASVAAPSDPLAPPATGR